MSLKKKLAMAIVTTTLGATIVAAGSFALFTSTASNTGNTFASGSLAINFDKQDKGVATNFYFNPTNIKPTYSETQPVVITDNGTLPLNYTLSADLGGVLAGPLEVAVYPSAADATAETNPIDLTKSRNLAANGTETVYVKVQWPNGGATDNAFEGKTGTLSLVANATQQ